VHHSTAIYEADSSYLPLICTSHDVVVDDVKQLAQKLCPELKAVLYRNHMKPAKAVAEMCDAETLQHQAANHVKAS